LSAYSVQLREKQKVKAIYGVGETQFHNYFRRAAKEPSTGEALISSLEARLDNVVYRLGFANSRPEARQIVRHGHVTVNARRINLPSYGVAAGETIGVRGGKSLERIQSTLANRDPSLVGWLTLDREQMKGAVVRLPEAEDIKDMIANVQLIVELYSR
jgi:small subunit ribosomal protein S4